MADGNSLGSDTQKRSWAFVYALLIAPENREARISHKRKKSFIKSKTKEVYLIHK
jgi:hypothetical protein